MIESFFTPRKVAIIGASRDSEFGSTILFSNGGTVAVKEALIAMSYLAVHHPDITELEINPLYVMKDGDGVVAIDLRGSTD